MISCNVHIDKLESSNNLANVFKRTLSRIYQLTSPGEINLLILLISQANFPNRFCLCAVNNSIIPKALKSSLFKFDTFTNFSPFRISITSFLLYL